MNSSGLSTFTVQLISVSRCDRWRVYQRLQELEIACQCAQGGSLSVAIPHPIAAVQLRSVVQQLTAPRQELISWLERCWQHDIE